MTATTNETARRTKAPSHIAWFVPERENAAWSRIGAQWPTKDGRGFRMVLDGAARQRIDCDPALRAQGRHRHGGGRVKRPLPAKGDAP